MTSTTNEQSASTGIDSIASVSEEYDLEMAASTASESQDRCSPGWTESVPAISIQQVARSISGLFPRVWLMQDMNSKVAQRAFSGKRLLLTTLGVLLVAAAAYWYGVSSVKPPTLPALWMVGLDNPVEHRLDSQ